MLLQLNLINWILAFIPILVILILMMSFHWSGGRSGAASWLIAIAIGLLFFGANGKLLSVASIKGLWNTIFILYIIWGAMAIYNIVNKIEGFTSIANTFTKLTGGNRIIQLLILGWAFPSFLQGVLGFGTPVAVSAPLLIGLKFNPIVATTSALLGHSWAVTFGSLGSSYAAILQTTGLNPEKIAFWGSLFLAIVCIMVGFSICFIYNGLNGVKEGWFPALFFSLTMGTTLILTANFVSPYLASVVAGLMGLIFGGFVLPKITYIKKKNENNYTIQNKSKSINFNVAFTPYYILFVMVLIVYLSPLKSLLSGIKIGLSFPETSTKFGFINQAVDSYSPIAIFTTPGTVILLTIVITITYYHFIGLWKKQNNSYVLTTVTKQAFPATLTVMTMSMMAMIMMETGLTNILAQGTANYTKSLFSIFSPFIGLLGSFMTGSNTSSNILFGAFQRDVANILGLNAFIIAALQTTGGAIGNAICPMNVALATAVTRISGKEGEVIKKTIIYALLMVLIIGGLGFLLTNIK